MSRKRKKRQLRKSSRENARLDNNLKKNIEGTVNQLDNKYAIINVVYYFSLIFFLFSFTKEYLINTIMAYIITTLYFVLRNIKIKGALYCIDKIRMDFLFVTVIAGATALITFYTGGIFAGGRWTEYNSYQTNFRFIVFIISLFYIGIITLIRKALTKSGHKLIIKYE